MLPNDIRLSLDERLDMVYEILARAEAPLTAKQVASRAGVSKTWAWKCLNMLAASGDAGMLERKLGYPIPAQFWFCASHQRPDGQDPTEWAARLVFPGAAWDHDDTEEQQELPF